MQCRECEVLLRNQIVKTRSGSIHRIVYISSKDWTKDVCGWCCFVSAMLIHTFVQLTEERSARNQPKQLLFFFLHCRASTGHGRSTLEECESKKG